MERGGGWKAAREQSREMKWWERGTMGKSGIWGFEDETRKRGRVPERKGKRMEGRRRRRRAWLDEREGEREREQVVQSEGKREEG